MKILIVGQEISKRYKNKPAWSMGNSSKRLWSWFGVTSYNNLRKIADTFNVINKKEVSIDEKINKGNYDLVFLVGKIASKHYEERKFFIRVKHSVQRLLHPSGLNVSCNFKDHEMKHVINHAIELVRKDIS